jgi:hypothetical protein
LYTWEKENHVRQKRKAKAKRRRRKKRTVKAKRARRFSAEKMVIVNSGLSVESSASFFLSFFQGSQLFFWKEKTSGSNIKLKRREKKSEKVTRRLRVLEPEESSEPSSSSAGLLRVEPRFVSGACSRSEATLSPVFVESELRARGDPTLGGLAVAEEEEAGEEGACGEEGPEEGGVEEGELRGEDWAEEESSER